MKASELRQMSGEELRNKEAELREDLFKLRFQHKIRSLENPALALSHQYRGGLWFPGRG